MSSRGLFGLTGDEAHHVARVLRLEPGGQLAVFDGRGHEWQATIVSCAPRRIDLRLERAIDTPVEAPLSITLFQGQCKPDRMDWVVQKSTELGIDAVLTVSAERSKRSVASPRQLERWRRIAVEACKQSGRRRLPRIEGADGLPPVEPGTAGLLLDPAASTPMGDALSRPAGPVWIAVGPESGFSADEIAAAVARGWRGVSLGPRVLRTDTAGIVAAAIGLHLWGDLGRSTPR